MLKEGKKFHRWDSNRRDTCKWELEKKKMETGSSPIMLKKICRASAPLAEISLTLMPFYGGR